MQTHPRTLRLMVAALLICLLTPGGARSVSLPGKDPVYALSSSDSSEYIFGAIHNAEQNTPVPTTMRSNEVGQYLPTSLGSSSGRIAFVSWRDPSWGIYVMNADGTNPTRLTGTVDQGGSPAWSPDGLRIAFTSIRDGNEEIYVMNADGSDQARLTSNPAKDIAPAWSPDGSRIAFHSDRDGKDQIYVMSADGTNEVNLTNNETYNREPDWSPDGSQVAFALWQYNQWEIYVMNSDGTNLHRLTDNPADDCDPAWSPDGSKIAFMSTRDGNFNIYVMHADGTGQTRLTSDPTDDYHAAWSPDGSKIAFTATREGYWQIYVMNPDGSDQTNLTNTTSHELTPAWTPGGFSPHPHGYSFKNEPAHTSWDIFRDTFGAENVECDLKGVTVPCPLALLYYTESYACIDPFSSLLGYCTEIGSTANCGGMVASSALLYKGWAEPGDFLFEQGAANTYSLDAPSIKAGFWESDAVADFIVKYQGYQQGQEIRSARATAQRKTLAETVDVILDSVDGGLVEPQVMGIYGLYKGECAGHALLPYRYEVLGSTVYVYVYDPNKPGRTDRFVLIDPSAGTWRYDHEGKIGLWSESHNCGGLLALNLALWKQHPTPPWTGSDASVARSSSDANTFDVSVGRNASLLITDSAGRELGFRDGEFVSTIPGGMLDLPIGVHPDVIPDYPERYYISSTLPLTFSMQFSDTGQAPLLAFVPGGLVKVVNTASGEISDTLQIAPDASSVSVSSGSLAGGRSLSLMTEKNALGAQHTINDITLDAGTVASLAVDPSGETIAFTSSFTQAAYGVEFRRYGKSSEWFLSTGPELSAWDSHFIYVDWTDTTTATVGIDHGSDGTVDEVVTLQNAYHLRGGTSVKTVTPTGQVLYGDELTYTLVISATPGTQLGLYDPLEGSTFERFVERPSSVSHTDGVINGTLYLGGVISGTLEVTLTNQVTVSFVTRVAVPGTVGWTADVTNRACVFPLGGTLGTCIWSNEVKNQAFRPYDVFLPLVLRTG